MYVKIRAKLVSVTDVEKVGQKQIEKFTLVLKRTVTMMEEVFDSYYAVSVFPKDGKNMRENFIYYVDKVVDVTVKINSSTYVKDNKINYINNINFYKIEKAENTLKKNIENGSLKPENEKLEESSTLFDDQKKETIENVSEVIEEKIIEPIEGESHDDLQF